MKKIIMAALLASSFSGAMANDGSRVHFGILDNSSGSPVLNATAEVSRMKGEPVCWFAQGLPARTPLKVVETFNAPAGSVFERPDSVIQVNTSATEHTLSYQTYTDDKGQHLVCWAFGSSDPIGLYQHKVKLNDQEFGTNEFQLVR